MELTSRRRMQPSQGMKKHPETATDLLIRRVKALAGLLLGEPLLARHDRAMLLEACTLVIVLLGGRAQLRWAGRKRLNLPKKEEDKTVNGCK